MTGYVIGFALALVLGVVAVRALIRRRKLATGQMQRCSHCGRPYQGTPAYCPACGEVLRHGSLRR